MQATPESLLSVIWAVSVSLLLHGTTRVGSFRFQNRVHVVHTAGLHVRKHCLLSNKANLGLSPLRYPLVERFAAGHSRGVQRPA